MSDTHRPPMTLRRVILCALLPWLSWACSDPEAPLFPAVEAACTPSCDFKYCGDDGCGQVCGTCEGAQEVCTEGQCVCVPDCTSNICGPDGCGGACGDDMLCAPTAVITGPPDETVYVLGADVIFQGKVEDPYYEAEDLTVMWSIAGLEVLFEGPATAAGRGARNREGNRHIGRGSVRKSCRQRD